MKTKSAIVLLVVVATIIVWLQLQTQNKLRAENNLLQQQIAQLKAGDENLSELTNQISAEDKFRIREWHIINATKELYLAMRLFAGDHNNQYATNINQLLYEFGPSDLIKSKNGNLMLRGDNVSLDSFEFVNVGKVNASTTNAIIFREKIPRVAPNGWWYRVYGLADGEVESVFGDDQGDQKKFIEYEQQHSPPQNQ